MAAESSSSDFPEQFKPGPTYLFPRRKFGKGKDERSFRPDWCNKYEWLHYDAEKDAAFCYLCMRADHEKKFLFSTKRDPAFLSKGFTYWKEATTAFRKHQESECHHEANCVILSPLKHTIGELLSKEHQKEQEMNRKILIRILQNIRYLARQGLPLRGSNEDADSNFIQLLLLRSSDSPEIIEWMRKKTNKYTSPVIQNECIQIMALRIVRQVSQNIRDSACFTIMADECTDKSNKEQFTICMRWVGEDLEDHEDFIGLYEVDGIDANSLVHAIKDTLLRMGLSLCQCRGQCYDGASNMSGSKGGVAAQLLAEEKRAVYTHCYAHALNLAVGRTIKESKICCDALDVAFEITKLIKFSPKRNAAFDRIKSEAEDDSVAGVGIRTFCPTRWTVRGDSICSILENYNILIELWDECLDTRLEPDIKGRIIGVKTQMTHYKLLFGLHLCERILKITDNLSKTLQTESLSASEAQQIAKYTIQTLQGMRTDDMFDLFYEHVESLRERTDTEEPTLPRKRRVPSRFEVGQGEGYHSPTAKDYYRTCYFEALDLVISSIQERFDQPGYAVYCNLEELLLKAANSKDYSSELDYVTEFYGSDFDKSELSMQLQILSSNIRDEMPSCENINLQEILTFVRKLSKGQRAFFKQICWIVRLILVMPSTNASSERSFSAMKRLKTYLRSTMGQSRLNHLMVLNTYKEMLDSMDIVSVANEFVKANEHRLHVFGHFEL